MKKFIILLICIVVILSVTACSGEGASSSEESSSNTNQTEEPSADTETTSNSMGSIQGSWSFALMRQYGKDLNVSKDYYVNINNDTISGYAYDKELNNTITEGLSTDYAQFYNIDTYPTRMALAYVYDGEFLLLYPDSSKMFEDDKAYDNYLVFTK